MIKMRLFISVILLFLLAACDMRTKPYLKHEVSVAFATGSCNSKSGMRVETNIVGERYLFQDCVQPGFSDKDVTVHRRGDTVDIIYGKRTGAGQLLDFIVTVKTHPRYHFINIAGETYPVVTAAY